MGILNTGYMGTDNAGKEQVMGSLNNLINTLYRTAYDVEAWDSVSEGLRAMTGSSKTVYAVRNWSDNQIVDHHQYGFSENAFNLYEEYYFKVDIYSAGLARRPANRFHAQHQYLRDHEFLNSEVYTDYAGPNDIRFLTGCVVDIPNSGQFGHLATVRGHDGGEFSDEILKKLDLLAPHFEQALLLGQKFKALNRDIRSRERIIEQLPDAVFVLSENCEVLFHNKAAENVLSASTILRVDGRRLFVLGLDPDERLEEAVKRASSAASGELVDGGKAFLVENEDCSLEIKIFPFRFRRDGEANLYDVPCAMVIVGGNDGKMDLSKQTLKMLYNLTKSEALVVSFLSQGLTPREIASERGVSLDTVRAQIRSIHQKTGCSNLAQLLSKILGGISRLP